MSFIGGESTIEETHKTDAKEKEILVTGFSLCLIGWNGVYHLQNDGSYHLPPHTLYLFGFIPIDIFGVTIAFANNRWKFRRQYDNHSFFSSDHLFGVWKQEFQVSRDTCLAWYWCSQFHSLLVAIRFYVIWCFILCFFGQLLFYTLSKAYFYTVPFLISSWQNMDLFSFAQGIVIGLCVGIPFGLCSC